MRDRKRERGRIVRGKEERDGGDEGDVSKCPYQLATLRQSALQLAG